MDDVMLGRPLLKCLGFDLDKFFRKICEKGEELDVSARLTEEINSTNPTIALV